MNYRLPLTVAYHVALVLETFPGLGIGPEPPILSRHAVLMTSQAGGSEQLEALGLSSFFVVPLDVSSPMGRVRKIHPLGDSFFRSMPDVSQPRFLYPEY